MSLESVATPDLAKMAEALTAEFFVEGRAQVALGTVNYPLPPEEGEKVQKLVNAAAVARELGKRAGDRSEARARMDAARGKVEGARFSCALAAECYFRVVDAGHDQPTAQVALDQLRERVAEHKAAEKAWLETICPAVRS